MNFFKFIFNRFDSLHNTALLLGAMTIISYIVALIRDRFFVATLGPSTQLDLYIASFKIPDAFFIMFISLASVYTLLPSIERAAQKGEKNEKEFLNTFFYVFSLLIIFGAFFVFVFTPFLTKIIFQGFSAGDIITLSNFSRLLIFQVVLLALSNFFAAIIQHERRFLIYALTPIVYNFGIIFGLLVFYPNFGNVGLTFGVIFGAFLHFAIQIPYLFKVGKIPKIRPSMNQMKNVYDTMILSIPRSLAVTSSNISILIIFGLIPLLGEGLLSVFYLAENLSTIPYVLIGLSYSIASFPHLTKSFADKNKEEFNTTVDSVLSTINILIIPLLIGLIIVSSSLIEALFTAGLFTKQKAILTTWVFVAILFTAYGKAIVNNSARIFYSAQKTFQPVIVFIFIALFEISAVYLIIRSGKIKTFMNNFSELIAQTGSFEEITLVSIALSLTLVSLFGAFLMMILIKSYFDIKIKKFISSLFQSIVATVIMSFVLIISTETLFRMYDNIIWNLIVIFFSALISIIPWAITLYLLKNEEFLLFRSYIREKFGIRV